MVFKTFQDQSEFINRRKFNNFITLLFLTEDWVWGKACEEHEYKFKGSIHA